MAKVNKAATKSTRSSKSVKSLATQFDETDASEASQMMPPGEHEVRLNEITLVVDPKKGASVKSTYEIIDGDLEGKKISSFSKLTDVAGNKAPGMAYLKRDLALLGYDDVPGKKLAKILAEISDEQPLVIINVKVNGQYTNAYLQGLASEESALEDDEDEEDEDEEDEDETEDESDEDEDEDEDSDDEEDEDEDSEDDEEDEDEEDEEDEDESDEDEEEEEEPAPRKKASAKSPVKKRR